MFTFLAVSIIIATILIVFAIAQLNGANNNTGYTNDAVGIFSGHGNPDDYGNEYYN